ncbi:hypothetical protein KGQ20_14775 [Catenulispora sp. NF23]|uniref:Lipoprotein n=1 Tax=Catenulispora pinistramenti TaxID=2705254 RepID=A0ABS5KX58_9ACTN|nr:hypothetical protein [Catenulispora pinistramenti]MBS2534035.1 hypothetical protein [Catenulispora pinistramenti]MBS2550661.1 hypothetical protein [Catenulispora pinistramenti]
MVNSLTSRSRVRVGGSALAGLLLAASLAACGSSGSSGSNTNSSDQSTDSGASGDSGGSASGGDTSSAPPSPTAMSSAAYAQSLTSVSAQLAPDVAAVVNAETPDAAKTALSKLSTDANNLSSGLPSDPPDALSAPTQQLSTALGTLSTSADSTANDVGAAVCTSASALAEFTRSDGAKAMRDAATALGAVDPAYGKDVAGFLPAPIADQTRQLGNGQVLRHSSGPGSLTINNSGTDAVVTLTKVGTKTPVASVYVRGNGDTTLDDIPGDTFDIYVSSGTDWDSAAQKFTRQCSFQKTDSTWDFSDSNWSLTLTPVENGNLTVSQLGAGDAPNP